MKRGDPELVRILLDAGAKFDPEEGFGEVAYERANAALKQAEANNDETKEQAWKEILNMLPIPGNK